MSDALMGECRDALETVDAMFSAPGRYNKSTIRDRVRAVLAKLRDPPANGHQWVTLRERLSRKELVSIVSATDCFADPVPLPEPTPQLVNPDGPEAAERIAALEAALTEIRSVVSKRQLPITSQVYDIANGALTGPQ